MCGCQGMIDRGLIETWTYAAVMADRCGAWDWRWQRALGRVKSFQLINRECLGWCGGRCDGVQRANVVAM
ncbi:G-type lectin S-receptor-like serine/threonine-protein kinase [Trichinella spiralis]|uniref:G-type lectin S-receptor-like serine/threonine-protein kinase n=1 Tax=Trichinella spiralis TaxID=6334 RepID=A0ABR3KBL4_TRISP